MLCVRINCESARPSYSFGPEFSIFGLVFRVTSIFIISVTEFYYLLITESNCKRGLTDMLSYSGPY